jgi:GNAT superfamily N-acetyltransferase
MSSNIIFRPFKDTDLIQVQELVHHTIDISYRADYTPEVIEFFKEYHPQETIRSDAETGYTVVATDNSKIVGTGTLLGTNVRRLFVEPDKHHQGIGTLIVNELEKRAADDGLYILDLSSALGARTFWEKHGYSVMEEHFTPAGDGRIIHYYTMTKIISKTL